MSLVLECDNCGDTIFEGTCTSCGLVDEEYQEYQDDYPVYPEDNQIIKQHGDFRKHSISDIAVMTVVNPNEAKSPNLRRALQMEGWFGWGVQKAEILSKNISRICNDLNLNKIFLDSCYYFLRKYRDKLDLTGRALEDVSVALVYTLVRIHGKQITLFDFKQLGYDTRVIYRLYVYVIKTLNLFKRIKRQSPLIFVNKFINSLMNDDPKYYNVKHDISMFVASMTTVFYAKTTPIGYTDPYNVDGGNVLAFVSALTYYLLKGIDHPVYRFGNVTQKVFAEHGECSEVTLRKYIKIIEATILEDE